MTRHVQTVASILVLAGAYFCLGKLGLSLAFVHDSASAVWPPTGLALAALLLRGYRLWPGISLGAFLVNLTTQGSPATALGIATGNTLEALVAAWLVQRFANGRKTFEQAGTILRFVGLAAFLSTLISATLGVTSLCLGRFATWEQFWPVWLTWWLGDMISNCVVAPLLVIWATEPSPSLSRRRLLEAVALLIGLILVGQVVFLRANLFPADNHPFEYLAIPPLLWAAFRFGQRGAVTSALAMSAIALWGTRHDLGPFASADPNSALLLLQAFMGTITMTALVLAAAVSERRRAEQRLQVQDAVSRVLAESPTLKEATPRIIQALCEMAGWDVGAIWNIDRRTDELFCAEFWRSPAISVPEFEATTRQIRFRPGIGLPGRVWSQGQAAWIRDVTMDDNFPRAPMASKEGLHAGFCFPLKFGHEVVGIIECFSRQIRSPDNDLLQMLADIGGRLGQFIARQRADEARRHTETLKGAILDSALDAVICMDQEGRIVEFNPAAERTFGYVRSQVLDQTMADLIIPPRLREQHRRGLAGFLATGRGPILGKRIEIVALHADGREIPVELTINVVQIEGKQVFTATLRDITERRATADRLARSQKEEESRRQELEALMEAVPAIVWIAQDPECRHITGNRAGHEFLRLPPGKNLSKTPAEADRPEHFQVYRNGRLLANEELPMQVVGRTGQPKWGEELEERFSDGSIRWLYGNVVPLLHGDGSVRGVIATFVDITERKHAEEVRAKLAAIVESSDDAIISKTLAGVVMSWNEGAERLFGYRAEEMVGQSLARILPPERLDEEADILNRLRAGQSIDHFETVRVTKEGQRIDVSLTISPVRDEAGVMIGASKIVRDITERKKTEVALEEARAALKAHAATLELMVAERTQELRETIAEVESFSYSISHDMRGPLRAIQGYAAVLEQDLKGKIGEEESEYLRRMAAASVRLTNLVQDILNYSQISRSRLQLAPIDLQALILEVIQHNPNLQPPLADLHIEGPLPMVLGHETALTQICSNLLGNAVKFVYPGTSPRIRIRAERDKDRARIWIADNGIGIDAKNHERIFQMFERVNSPKDYDGTGIGLAIVKKAVERMGGKLGVQSELGKGAEFWFELRSVD